MQVEFTKEEAQVLINLINVAVKAIGLEAAGSAVILAGKIEKARFNDSAKDDAEKVKEQK